jgi:hypothetical protein
MTLRYSLEYDVSATCNNTFDAWGITDIHVCTSAILADESRTLAHWDSMTPQCLMEYHDSAIPNNTIDTCGITLYFENVSEYSMLEWRWR